MPLPSLHPQTSFLASVDFDFIAGTPFATNKLRIFRMAEHDKTRLGFALVPERDAYRAMLVEQDTSKGTSNEAPKPWPELPPRPTKHQIIISDLRNFLEFLLLKDCVSTSSTRIEPAAMDCFTRKDFIFFNFQLTTVRRFNYPWNHSLFKFYNRTRKIVKGEGSAELAKKIYLDLNITIPALFRHGNRAIYHEIYYSAQAVKNHWFSNLDCSENITIADMRRRYLSHFEALTTACRLNYQRLQRRGAVVWPSSTDSTRVGMLLWVERKVKRYHKKQAKKMLKKMRANNRLWASETLVHPDLGVAMSEDDWAQKLRAKGRLDTEDSAKDMALRGCGLSFAVEPL
ncbi:hypothetical protein AOQ84DRAFT_414630 [Glonium stellatum]|uniref:Uncharacterized protein n=1 Tax=Glonium stellatum TaxID=574774 RepID=A0A8E2EUS1_9PEZI|nr:hypothetical protein AOQ84DRAFT_414630 [Glonium stellatum]